MGEAGKSPVESPTAEAALVSEQTKASTKAQASPMAPARGFTSTPKTPVSPQPSPVQSLATIIESLLSLPQLQEGGEIQPGEAAIVGEAGPEVVQAEPQGGAAVTPFTAAKPPKGLEGNRLLNTLGNMAIGAALGGQGMAQLQARRAQAAQNLVQIGIANPHLLRTNPNIVQAVDQFLGEGTSQTLVNRLDPNFQARALAQAFGLELPQEGFELAQLSELMGSRGWDVTTTSKGELRLNRAARAPEQQDEIQAWRDYQGIIDRSTGVDELTAHQNAAKRVMQLGANKGYLVPDVIKNMAMAEPNAAVASLEAAKREQAVQAVQLDFAGPKATAAEAAKRAARLNTPISEDEIRSSSARLAERFGGVVYGSKMTDDDLQAAEAQGFVLKQQPNGQYIGIPSSLVRADSQVFYPTELLAKRIANKMATKQTTQEQNARLVMSALDDIDRMGSLSLLVPASPQGPSLPSMVAGALQTEVRGQIIGRPTLWASRRSTNPVARNRAVSLFNLKTLTTSFVKATGDVGAISEADKALIAERFTRIANGSASREEAASQLQRIRAMMMLIISKGKIEKGSPEAEETKAQIHDILTSPQPPTNQPPPGFKAAPGTGAFYKILP